MIPISTVRSGRRMLSFLLRAILGIGIAWLCAALEARAEPPRALGHVAASESGCAQTGSPPGRARPIMNR